MVQSGPRGRVGILTLQLSTNYGGILQMLALHDAIKQQGGEPVLLDKHARHETLKTRISPVLARIPLQDLRGIRSKAMAASEHRRFFESRVAQISRPVRSGRDIEAEIARLGLSTVVVGSDQVWRMDYQKDGSELNYFLNFGGDALRRVAYAASFGHGHWAFPARSEEIRACLSRFDAISVREQSGQTICSEVFGREDTRFVLDPTLLHEAEYYRDMMGAGPKQGPCVLVYVLDRQKEARDLAAKIAAQRGNLPVRVLSPSARAFTNIPDWLSAFENAEFVVTDSYHGTIFSIIFQRPFLTLLNSQRGLDRFTSLFDSLGLSGHGLTDWDGTFPPVASQNPDYEVISAKISRLRTTSCAFLGNALAAAEKK
ncbi:polysaccharide pyruvyl transferase family protein [Sinirhodobacter ferrireducens]|uniref:Polysaccharide pyruvyl transferase family protein n=1 Tax=Paenirhodobacter ferrireducens TaxID=1215032 RepID=A0A443L543_9RHOB|nr:polysaccharide pyruvyl transferase family protein [Sinirhodobacter ferrireducens]RWR44286.1 polysaccharide pyruvyl transferase family protein [Sinirhodobacter ferrireducens]